MDENTFDILMILWADLGAFLACYLAVFTNFFNIIRSF